MNIMNEFYVVNTEKFFNTITKELKNLGYEWVGINKNPTFPECNNQIHCNAKLIIHAFYNDITGKNEIQFGTKSIYRSYPHLRNIKYINDLTEIRNNAKMAAKRDGYNQVIIEDNDGYYSFSRKYDGCCPLWYGKIIEEITG